MNVRAKDLWWIIPILAITGYYIYEYNRLGRCIDRGELILVDYTCIEPTRSEGSVQKVRK